MAFKEPTVAVPVTVLLDLVRLYKENPQELLDRGVYLAADHLEKRAYRKYLTWSKALKVAKNA